MTTDETLLKGFLLVVAVLLLVPLVMMLVAVPMWGVMGGGHMWNGGTGPGWSWLFSLLILLGVLLGGGYLLFRALAQTDGSGDPAIDALRTSYARGNLTNEEFEERLERLRQEE